MTPDRWSRIKQVFDQASELTPDAREPFLDSCCNGDSDLRGEVQSLLAAEADAASRYDSPIVGAGLDHMIGQHTGSYRIIRRLGTGGMGDVYLGSRDDGQFRKLAAVKMIRFDLLDEHTRRRFENEKAGARRPSNIPTSFVFWMGAPLPPAARS